MQNLWVAGSAWKVQYGRCAGQKGVAAWSDMRALRGATRGRGSLAGCLPLHCRRLEVNAATLGAPGHFGAIASNHIVAGMDRRVHGNNAGLRKEGLEFTDSVGMWITWKERNARIFQNNYASREVTVGQLIEDAGMWTVAGRRLVNTLMHRPREKD